MRSLRSCFIAFALLGLSFFAIVPSRALAAEYVEYENSEYMYFVVPQSQFDSEEYKANLGNVKQVQQYHYSHQDLIDTGSVVSADYVIQQQHTDMFGGYLEVPSINTTASGTLKNNPQANSGLYWNPDWYFAPYKRSVDSQWGYKPMLSNSSSSYGYNAWVLSLNMNTTSNMTSGGYHIDMSNATSTGTITGTQTKDETIDTEGTLTHKEYTTLDYKWLPFTSNEPVYVFVGKVSASGTWAAWKDNSYYYDIQRYQYRIDNLTATERYLTGVKKCMLRSNSVSKLVEPVGNYKGIAKADNNYNFNGFMFPIDVNVTKGIYLPMPTLYLVDYSQEQNNTTETQNQTAALKDTTGSDTTVTNAQGVFNNTIKSKLGFVSQTADITTGLFDALTYEGEGTVPFPALKWQGQTIIAAQDVPILGYIPEIEDDVKTGVTLVLFLAWLHGIHSLYARMFLGETMVEVDEQ